MQFFESNGISVFFEKYPYWYLGATSYKYLTGPLVPLLAKFLKDLSGIGDFYRVSFLLLAIFMILSLIGWFILIKKVLNEDNKNITAGFAVIMSLIYVILPWKYLSALTMDEVGNYLAKCMIPFVLVSVWLHLKHRRRLTLIFSVVCVAVLMLFSTSVIPTLLAGLAGIGLTISLKTDPDGSKPRFKYLTKRFKRLAGIFIGGIALSTLWYGVGYWWAIFTNPGIGGASGLAAMAKLIEFGRNMLPLVLVILVLKVSHKIKDRLSVFAITWFTTFGLLSLYRFLANPYFWMDWSAWFYEAEIGFMLIALAALRRKQRLVSILSILTPIIITGMVYFALGTPNLVENSRPPVFESLKLLGGIPESSKVFISGSNVFWLNTAYKTIQVRGGRDEASLLPGWQKDSYILRESEKPEELKQSIKRLGVSYVLVNLETSDDYYKDFKNIEVWKTVGKEVGRTNTEVLYSVASN